MSPISPLYLPQPSLLPRRPSPRYCHGLRIHVLCLISSPSFMVTKVHEEVFLCHTIEPLLNSIIFALVYIKLLFFCFDIQLYKESKGGRAEQKAPWGWQLWVTGSGPMPSPWINTPETKILSGGQCQQTIAQKVCSLAAIWNFALGTPKVVWVSQPAIYKNTSYSEVDHIRPEGYPQWQVPIIK